MNENTQVDMTGASEPPATETQDSGDNTSQDTSQQDSGNTETQSSSDPNLEFIPEKYRNAENPVEALSKGYNELASKMGEQGTAKDSQTTVISSAQDEFAEKGELSEETYTSLENAGLSKELVDSYIQLQTQAATAYNNSLKEIAQGNWDSMANWAGQNLPDADLEAYNKAVNSGDSAMARMAVESVYSKFQAANGIVDSQQKQQMVQGNSTPPAGVKPFKNLGEMTAMQRDPRYKLDNAEGEAFRQELDKRLEISHNI